MKFSDVTGQEEIKTRLRKGVDEGRIGHAQLFSGMCGSGTLPLALAYVQYVNCTNRRDGDSCGTCASCRKIAALAHPDLHFVFPTNASKTGSGSQKPGSDWYLPQWVELVTATGGYFDEQMWYEAIGLDNQQGMIAKREADEVIRKLSFKSFEAEYKAVVIWLPEKMGEEAANTLLKILEEPWEKTLFLLVSSMPRRLLPTILSRTQQVEIPPVGVEALERYAVEKYGVGQNEARIMARMSGGDLLRLDEIVSPENRENRQEYFEQFVSLMRFCYNNRHLELLDWAENMATLGRESQKRFFVYSMHMLRENYMISAGMEDIVCVWGEEADFCRKFAPFIGNGNIEPLIAEHEKALLHITQNGNAKIVFTHFALTVSKMIGKN